MRRMVRIISILLIVFTFWGCGPFINSEKIAKQQAEEIVKYLNEDDEEGLKSIFCYSSTQSQTLDKQIQEGMDFLDGKIVSYDVSMVSNSSDSEGGEIVEADFGAVVENIITDSNKEYDIRFHTCTVCKKDLLKQGISVIIIENKNGDKCTIGEYIEP